MNLPITILTVFLILATTSAPAAPARTLGEIKQVIHQANDRWQKQNRKHGDAFWIRAVYYVGNMNAYEITREPAYLRYSEAWAKHNQWKGAKSDQRAEWLYSYGESDRFLLFGDWQVCF